MLNPELIPLSLYIHMPWCVRKCPYCDFNSHSADKIDEDAYINALLKDFATEVAFAGMQNRPITSIFIGGGTPSLFSAQAIARLLSVIKQTGLLDKPEITLEANPGSADSQRFTGYRDAGVNRLSIGVQSFDDAKLSALGRIHNGVNATNALDMARSAGFDNLNLDLMYGLPNQTESEALMDLKHALAVATEHISWYQLTLEPNTPFHHTPPANLADNDQLADISAKGIQCLAHAGYEQYEVSAYAIENRNCRHNLNYWKFGDYVGIGAGAHGKITQIDGRVLRRHKQRQPQRYMSAVAAGNGVSSSHELSSDDLQLEFMMNGLRLNGGFTQQDYQQRTGLDFAVIEKTLVELMSLGLLQRSRDHWQASAKGRLHLDSLLLHFS